MTIQKNSGWFKKGKTPWNKGVKGVCSVNSGSFKKGEHRSPKTEFKKGEKPSNFKGGKKYVEGYIYVYKFDHPYARKRYVAEHRLIMEEIIGRYLKEDEVVHHINGVKDDNRIDNLMLFPNRSAHSSFRHCGDKKFICKFCNKDQRTI